MYFLIYTVLKNEMFLLIFFCIRLFFLNRNNIKLANTNSIVFSRKDYFLYDELKFRKIEELYQITVKWIIWSGSSSLKKDNGSPPNTKCEWMTWWKLCILSKFPRAFSDDFVNSNSSPIDSFRAFSCNSPKRCRISILMTFLRESDTQISPDT